MIYQDTSITVSYCFAGICTIGIIVSLFFCSFSTDVVHLLYTNIEGSPLISIEEADYAGDCAEGTKLIIGIWPGTAEGCDCIGKYIDRDSCSNTICEGECNSNHTKSGCHKLNKVESTEITRWKNSEFCVTRLSRKYSRFNYLDLLASSTKTERECLNRGKKPCGYLDSLKNILCIPEGVTCPINSIKIDNIPRHDGYTTIPFRKFRDLYLHYANGRKNKYLIGKFRLSENHVCPDARLSVTLGNYKLEDNSNTCQVIGGLTNNPYFYEIDSYSKYRLFEENDIFPKLRDHRYLDKYSYSNEKISLFANIYSGFDYQCLQKHPLITNDNDYSKALPLAKILTIVILVLNIIQLFLMHSNFLPLYFILHLINIGLSVYCIKEIYPINITTPCADETTQNMLQDGQEKLNYFLWSEYIHFGVSFISLLYNILICSCGSKKYKYE